MPPRMLLWIVRMLSRIPLDSVSIEWNSTSVMSINRPMTTETTEIAQSTISGDETGPGMNADESKLTMPSDIKNTDTARACRPVRLAILLVVEVVVCLVASFVSCFVLVWWSANSLLNAIVGGPSFDSWAMRYPTAAIMPVMSIMIMWIASIRFDAICKWSVDSFLPPNAKLTRPVPPGEAGPVNRSSPGGTGSG